MKNRNTLLIIAFLAVLIFGAYLLTDQEASIQNQSEECSIENPDPDGYLLKICTYLRAHEDTIFPNKEPDDYSIKSIEDGQDFFEEWQGLWVIELDCCHTGDIALVDKETGEVVGFSPGDI